MEIDKKPTIPLAQEEWLTKVPETAIIKDLIPEGFVGTFIDVGAYHPTWLSNSYTFEKEGWTVYCIEPNIYCIPNLERHRKNVYNLAIGKENKDNVDFFVFETAAGVGSMAGFTGLSEKVTKATRMFGDAFVPREVTKIDLRTMDTFIKDNVEEDRVDVMSIDTEGLEMDVLGGFNINKYMPKVVVIENITGSEEQEVYLKQFGYILVRRHEYNDFYIKNSMDTGER
jgi:FkbM family methyltransferase